jgi:predicted GNAT family acetyltransferase
MHDFPKLSDFSPEDLIHMVDEHDDESFALAMGRHAAMQSEPGFYEILTGIKDPFANMAFGMHVPDAENRVKAISARLRDADCPAYFWVGPCTTPTNLSEILIDNGWTHLASPPAMVVDINLMAKPPAPEGMRLQRVTDGESLTEWRKAVSTGFHMKPEVTELFSLLEGNQMRLYTAFLGDEIVGTTALITHNGVAGIYCVSTFPEFRGRGIGAALTTLPLLEAHSEGYQIGTLQASSMGFPVYKRLGFQEVCKLQMYGFGLA